MRSLTNIKSRILDSDNSLTDQLNITYQELSTIEKYDSNISNISSLISESILQLEEASSEINSQLIEQEFNHSNPNMPNINIKQHAINGYDAYIPKSNTDQGGVYAAI